MTVDGTGTTGAAAKCFGIVGWKNSGKTTMTVRLVEAITARGFRVATIKHAHHTFRLDDGATDSGRHRRAGAAQVGIVSAERWALITDRPADDDDEPLTAMLERLDRADLVLVEGFKTASIPKLEVRRREAADQKPLWPKDPMVIAIATDEPDLDGSGGSDAPYPAIFDIDATERIAQMILNHHGLTARRAPS